jgi:hypothetical protein
MIDGVLQPFTSIRAFREAHNLPPSFGVAHFQPKDYTGLGTLERPEAGAALKQLRAALIEAVPARIPAADLPALAAALAGRFRAALILINPAIGLREEEVEFATAGFADVTRAFAYEVLRARLARSSLPSFDVVYGDWLQGSVRVSGAAYDYSDSGRCWQVKVVSHVYGRFGLIIDTGRAVCHVYDPSLACPAEGYMAALLREVCEALVLRLES